MGKRQKDGGGLGRLGSMFYVADRSLYRQICFVPSRVHMFYETRRLRHAGGWQYDGRMWRDLEKDSTSHKHMNTISNGTRTLQSDWKTGR